MSRATGVASFMLRSLSLAALVLCVGCRPEVTSDPQHVTYGTHLVMLEDGIHWAEWIKPDNTPCGDVYKWNDAWRSDTYIDGLEQKPWDTKEEAIAWVQKWCQ